MGRRSKTEAERFLEDLARGLEALGPAESAEVVAEVRSHLAEAVAEAGGDETAALKQFGGPALLARSILQERGALSEGTEIREASAGRRWAAVALDAIRWIVVLWILLAWTFIVGSGGSIAPYIVALAWTYIAVIAAVTIWWWVWKRRRSQVTAGMIVMGLRRVHLGDVTRIVRARDIPGCRGGRPTRVVMAAWALVIVLLFAWGSYGLITSFRGSSRSNQRQDIQAAVSDAGQAISVIQNIYAGLAHGDDISMWFAPQAAGAARQLAERDAADPIDYILTGDIQMPDYKSILSYDDPTGREIDAYITVTEIHNNGSGANYRYKVVYRVTQAVRQGNAGFISAQMLVEEVTAL
jgi:uncharacterized membrane protein